MNTMALLLAIGVVVILHCSHTDAKVIKIGGIKTPKPQPRTTRTPKPKPITLRPTIPWIVPLPIILPGFGRNSYVNKNSRLQCYSCEGSDNELCAVSPATSSKKVTCAEKNMFCSIVRKEVPITSTSGNANVTKTVDTTNQTDIVIVSTQMNTSLTSSSTSDPLSVNTPTSTEFPISSSTVDSMTTDASISNIDANVSNASLTRTTREINTRVIIQRGCKSIDFIEGISLASSTKKSGNNESEYVYAQLCTKDLCNSGDGRLRCYECDGTGLNDDCMVNPSKVGKVLTCQRNESCYVKRKTVVSSNSTTNSTETKITVKRGCRAASSSDDRNVITRTNSTSEVSCRLSDFCNSFDANRLVRSNSASGNHATFSSLVLTLFVSYLLLQK
uniref:UPAR/Ly6 domain-containing protein n=1 Tax=Daphnia galeata TaxID=27404 RepID=A0A8J2WER3_9CRUS|nr:unnamed protein product [Daphnia galeata]